MSHLSGWCSNYQGICDSPRAHATCQQRIDTGDTTCDCAGHDETREKDA